MCGNFIKIDRKITSWEWWGDINTFRVFIYMLISAYWKDGNYKGVPIPRGSFPTTLSKLAKDTNLTENEIRTTLKHLQSTGEITSKSTNKFTVFSVVNYGLYQTSDNENHRQNYKQITDKITNKSQTINKQITNDILKEKKEYKEDNINNNNIYNNNIYIRGNSGELQNDNKKRFVPPTVEEVKAYCIERKNNVKAEAFVDFYQSKNWYVGKNKMKDWKAAVRTWERSEKDKPKTQKKTIQNFEGRTYDMASLEQQLLGR